MHSIESDRGPLTPLEIACGMTLGVDPLAPPLPQAQPADTPRLALERSILTALRRPPCVVSFSGGRDSSAILAMAAFLARREGLELPIPVTNVFSEAPSTEETEWQELVVRHLGLDDWTRLHFTDELDFVGPVAQEVLTRYGVVYPANTHFHLPIFKQASGGSVLTGAFGDEVFSESYLDRYRAVLVRGRRPERRDVLRLGYMLAPAAVRGVALRNRVDEIPWLSPRAQKRARRARVHEVASQPVHWGRTIAWLWRLRYTQQARWAMSRLAQMTDVAVTHPFGDPGFLSAVAVDGGFAGPGNRQAVMQELSGDLLPERLLARRQKASFDEVFWNRHAAEFVAEWSPDGWQRYPVDAELVHRTWQGPIDNRSVLLLQAAWLESRGREPEA